MRYTLWLSGATLCAWAVLWLLRQREKQSRVSPEWLRLQQQGEQMHYEGVCWEWPVRKG